jgi:hypothetical protein
MGISENEVSVMGKWQAVVMGSLVATMLVFADPAGAADVKGKVKSVDAAGRTVQLEDGTTLVLPDDVRVGRDILRPGATVKASFDEIAGDKVVTSLQVIPSQ